VLYLEGNSIKKIEGLNHLKMLTSLYLHENCIEKIENLEGLDSLYNLNLSDNCIYKIENLSSLKSLSNLLLKRNRIGTNDLSDLSGLKELPEKLTVLDISDNRIEMTEIVKDYLTQIKNLRVLYMQGNECVRKTPHYRKTLINMLKELHYLDDKPVFDDERRFAEAFGRGGLEAEKRERALFKKEKEEYELNRLKDFQNLIDNWKKEKQGVCEDRDALLGLEGGDGNRNEQEGKEKAEAEAPKDEEQLRKEREDAKKKLLIKCKEKQQQLKNPNANGKSVKKNSDNISNNNNDFDFNAVDSESINATTGTNQGIFLSISEETIGEEVSNANDAKTDFDKKIDELAGLTGTIGKKAAEKPSNEIFDDLEDEEAMPTLEQVKFKKQAEYIDYVIEKNTYEEENQIGGGDDYTNKEDLENNNNNMKTTSYSDNNQKNGKETEEEVDTRIFQKTIFDVNVEQNKEADSEVYSHIKENKVSTFEELD